MNIVVCSKCGFAIGCCVCDRKQTRQSIVLPAYKDDPKLLALLSAKEILNE